MKLRRQEGTSSLNAPQEVTRDDVSFKCRLLIGPVWHNLDSDHPKLCQFIVATRRKTTLTPEKVKETWLNEFQSHFPSVKILLTLGSIVPFRRGNQFWQSRVKACSIILSEVLLCSSSQQTLAPAEDKQCFFSSFGEI